MDNPIKIAMMSLTHGHTRKYFQVLKENPLLKWIAVSASDVGAIEFFRDNVKDVPLYSSDEEMLAAHPEIEAVVIASENCEHLKQITLCAERGIHILSMKIPSLNLKEYDKMIELTEKNNVVCQVELELHYNPVVKRVKELVSSGALGKLHSFNATNITLSPVWAFPWQGQPEKSFGSRELIKADDNRYKGGALCDHPHIFDLIRTITKSEFDTIFARLAPNIRPDLVEEDMLSVVGKMKDGTIFSLDPSWSKAEERILKPVRGWEINPKRMEVNLTLTGADGSVLADCFGPNIYHNTAPKERYVVQYTYFDEWVGLIDEFVGCIRSKKEPMINLRHHKKTIEAMLAVYKSIETNMPVTL